jgi:hypothetical protein
VTDRAAHNPSRRRAAALLASLSPLALAAVACGGGEPEARAPVAQERPADEILRIGTKWESALEDKGFRTPPSPITMFSEQVVSVLAFTAESATAVETLTYDGTFKVRDTTYQCQARAELHVGVLFGRHSDEAAVEVRRPAAQIARNCNLPGFPEPVLDVPAAAARFALRGDRLVPIAPATEKRAYLPAP